MRLSKLFLYQVRLQYPSSVVRVQAIEPDILLFSSASGKPVLWINLARRTAWNHEDWKEYEENLAKIRTRGWPLIDNGLFVTEEALDACSS